MRSGSTAFAETLAERLNRPYCAVTDTSNEDHPLTPDDMTVYSTHSFYSIRMMEHYDDPLLIRCTRRDLAEQCLSHLLAKKINSQVLESMRFWNYRRDEDRNTNSHTFENA